jgi:hypothetical protein
VVDKDDAAARINESEAVQERAFTLGCPPAGTTTGDVLARRGSKDAVYRAVQLLYQAYILAVLEVYLKDSVASGSVRIAPSACVIAERQDEPVIQQSRNAQCR